MIYKEDLTCDSPMCRRTWTYTGKQAPDYDTKGYCPTCEIILEEDNGKELHHIKQLQRLYRWKKQRQELLKVLPCADVVNHVMKDYFIYKKEYIKIDWEFIITH